MTGEIKAEAITAMTSFDRVKAEKRQKRHMIGHFVKLLLFLVILYFNGSCNFIPLPDTAQINATGTCCKGLRITKPEIDAIFKKLWPDSYLAMSDERYWKPTRSDLEKLVRDSFVERYLGTKEIMDCDDHALILHAFVIQKRYRQMEQGKLKKPQWYPWAFGQAWGAKFHGAKISHAVNIAITKDEKVLLIDSKRDRIWEANPDKDQITYVRM